MARKIVKVPSLRVMMRVGSNRYEWHSPLGLTYEELEICGVLVFTDHQTGGKYSPILL